MLNEIEILLKENSALKSQLVSVMKSNSDNRNEEHNLKGLLKDLCECASSNQGKKSRGWRYQDYLKELGSMFYILGGLQLYEFFAANLPIPSVSTIRSHIRCTEVVREGAFRIRELKDYLESRNEPLFVFLSEDATRVVPRRLYHLETNQIVGPVPPLDAQGCPIVGNFPADSATSIIKSFSEPVSNYAYAMMAQTLCGSPPFCLSLFGTNNKFDASVILRRWTWLKSSLKEEGIEVIGFSSDGDSRLMKAMRTKTFVRSTRGTPWKWFQANLKVSEVCFQDFVHLCVKLRVKFTKPSVLLPIGPEFVASKGHVAELISKTKFKDQHELSSHILDNRDKMNFPSAEKLCAKKVTDLLRSEIVESEGSATYLDMMRDVYRSCADPSLSPQERIEILWEWVFFLRFWRQWIVNHDTYTLTHNFITSNAYYCIEINAHALIQSMIMFRDTENHHLFKPWLFNSQPCESLFRCGRSMTTTFSTVINFSIMEMLYRVRRMEFLMNAQHQLQDRYTFPRHKRAFESRKVEEFRCLSLPEDYQIEEYIQTAFRRALERGKKLKVISGTTKPSTKNMPVCQVPLVPIDEVEEEHDEGENDPVDGGVEDQPFDAFADLDDLTEEINGDVNEDLVISTSPHGLKTFPHAKISPTSPFVEVSNSDGGVSIIKKTTLCWLLTNDHCTLSNDRLIRVRAEASERTQTQPRSHNQSPVKEEVISIGSWCAFVAEDKSLIIGRVIDFRFMSGTSYKNQEYSSLTASVTEGSRKVGCMCSWFLVKKAGSQCCLQPVTMDSQGFYDLEHYICTVPRPTWDQQTDKLILQPTDIPLIKELANNRLRKC